MFFRNQKPKVENFEERIAGLKELGFVPTMESAGRCRVTRGCCGAIIEDLGGGKMGIGKAGVLVGGEIALLIHGGYQMFLRTPSGKEVPALAPHLKTLHEFDDDLREGLRWAPSATTTSTTAWKIAMPARSTTPGTSRNRPGRNQCPDQLIRPCGSRFFKLVNPSCGKRRARSRWKKSLIRPFRN
jgi:hypothetical protein